MENKLYSEMKGVFLEERSVYVELVNVRLMISNNNKVIVCLP